MKKLLIISFLMLFLSSCLKESIADAMLDEERGDAPAAATMSYLVNGNQVTVSVDDPDKQSPTDYRLGCSKILNPGAGAELYSLNCVGETGEFTFTFGTDSLKVGNYIYKDFFGELFIMSYNNTDGFLRYPTDSVSFNITSYNKGHISGNFSASLTKMISAGYPNNSYDSPGSISITNGSFKDVPVFY